MRALTGLADPDAMLGFYPRLGSKVVLLKIGSEDAYLGTAEARVRISAHRVVPVDGGTRFADRSWRGYLRGTDRRRRRAMPVWRRH